MLGKKGLNSGVLFIAAIMVVLVGAIAFVGMKQLAVQPTVKKEYDGQFANFQPVQELTGYNDLSVTKQEINDSTYTVSDGNVVSNFDINGSDGDTVRYAFGFEIEDGPVENLEVLMEEDSSTQVLSNDYLDTKDAWVAIDEDDDFALDDSEVKLADLTIDSDGEIDDEVTLDLEKGNYVMVVEVRGSDTASISTDDNLFDLELDVSGEDAEDLDLTIDNSA